MCIIEKILEGLYSNILPTAFGVFLGIWGTELIKDKSDKKLFLKIVDNAVIEQLGLISRSNTLSDFLKKRVENSYVSTPTEFVRINLQIFPTHVELLNVNLSNKYVKPSLIQELLLERQNLEVIKQRFLIANFNNDDDVLKSLESFKATLLNLIWIEYQMSQNMKIEQNEIRIKSLIEYVQQNRLNEILSLNKLKIE